MAANSHQHRRQYPPATPDNSRFILPQFRKKEPMETVQSPAHPDVIAQTRANSKAIQDAFQVRQTQARLIELAALVGPAAEQAGLLRNEIRQLDGDLKTLEGSMMATITAAVDGAGKKLHTNKEARDGALSNATATDASYQVMAGALNEKRNQLTRWESASTAIVTEIGALKAVAAIGAAALNALGMHAV